MGSVTELTGSHQFILGLVAGVVASVAVAAVAVRGDRRPTAVPLAGLGYVAACLVGLTASDGGARGARPDGWGLVAVAVGLAGGWIAQRAPRPGTVLLVLAPAGVAAGFDTRHLQPSWISTVAVFAVIIGGVLAADFDVAQHRYSLGPLLLAGTVLGIYVTVPDTEAARVFVGAALPFALLALALPRVALGTGGAAAVVTLWVLVVARDGAARPGAVVGGIAALGLFVAEPVGRRLAASLPDLPPVRGRLAVVVYALVLDGVVVVWCTRVAGLRRDGLAALVLTVPAAVVGVAGSLPLARNVLSAIERRRTSPLP